VYEMFTRSLCQATASASVQSPRIDAATEAAAAIPPVMARCTPDEKNGSMKAATKKVIIRLAPLKTTRTSGVSYQSETLPGVGGCAVAVVACGTDGLRIRISSLQLGIGAHQLLKSGCEFKSFVVSLFSSRSLSRGICACFKNPVNDVVVEGVNDTGLPLVCVLTDSLKEVW
jgi:hypothetical protein